MGNKPKPLVPGDVRHGSIAGYQAGCTKRADCEQQPTCVDAERAYQVWRTKQIAYGRPLKVPAIGTKRRVQALLCQGWPGQWIGEQVGANRAVISCIYPTVRTGLAEAIRELYERYQYEEGPSPRTRGWAANLGYIPPYRWEGVDMDDPEAEPLPEESVILDEVAIERRLAGENQKLTKPELIRACHLARERGISNPPKVLNINDGTYHDYLERDPYENARRPAQRAGLPPGDTGDGEEVRPDPHPLHRAGEEGLASAS